MIKRFKELSSNTQHLSPNLGFTLIELLVVISILGILASFVIASMSGAQKQARDSQRKSDLSQYRNALETYSAGNSGIYPPYAAATLLTTVYTSYLSNYMSATMDDPITTRHYYFISTAANPIKYIIYANLEKGAGTGYWFLCSTGLVNEKTSLPALADCP